MGAWALQGCSTTPGQQRQNNTLHPSKQQKNKIYTYRLREGFVRLAGDRPQRHGAGVEALHDLSNGLHLVQGDRQRRLVLEPKETPASHTTGTTQGTRQNKQNPKHAVGKGATRKEEQDKRY